MASWLFQFGILCLFLNVIVFARSSDDGEDDFALRIRVTKECSEQVDKALETELQALGGKKEENLKKQLDLAVRRREELRECVKKQLSAGSSKKAEKEQSEEEEEPRKKEQKSEEEED